MWIYNFLNIHIYSCEQIYHISNDMQFHAKNLHEEAVCFLKVSQVIRTENFTHFLAIFNKVFKISHLFKMEKLL